MTTFVTDWHSRLIHDLIPVLQFDDSSGRSQNLSVSISAKRVMVFTSVWSEPDERNWIEW